jgi:glycosyltransferase involved in cell wall biosynthesis/SAM-dependent methyltransferase
MHPSALNFGKLFYQTYCANLQGAVVYDVGAQNVNGSLRDVLPPHLGYVGIDFVAGNGVDIVLEDPYRLPFPDASLDVLVCNSCFEHSQFFWLVFLEMLRVLKPQGLLYLNAPSNGSFHRYPVDCWRFYPDSGRALEAWAVRNGYQPQLLESFVGERSPDSYESGGAWHDFVAVFVKDRQHAGAYPARMLDVLGVWSNGYDSRTGAESRPEFLSPDQGVLVAREHTIAALHQQQADAEERIADLLRREQEGLHIVGQLREQVAQRDQHIVQRDQNMAALTRELATHTDQLMQDRIASAERMASLLRVNQELTDMVDNLRKQIAERDQRMTALTRELATHADQLAQDRMASAERMTSLMRENQDLTGMADTLRKQVAEREQTLSALGRELAAQSVQTQQIHGADEARIHAAHARLEELLHSRSWRLMAPVRKMTDAARVVRRRVRSLAGRLGGAGDNIADAGADAAAPISAAPQPPSSPIDAEVAAIRDSGKFDLDYYRAQSPELAIVSDPIRHYCETGWREGRNPSAAFDTSYYLETSPDIREAGINPFLHYVTAGCAEGRLVRRPRHEPSDADQRLAEARLVGEIEIIRDSGQFDEAYYRAMNSDLYPGPDDVIRHYCEYGWREGRNPSPEFDTDFYLKNAPDIRAAGMNPFLHYVMAGLKEGRPAHPTATRRSEEVLAREVSELRASGQFDEAYYRAMNADIQPPPVDVIRHYCERGWLEGRDPSDDFDTRGYLAIYRDIREAGINPFWHYVTFGASELRTPHPRSIVRYEDDVWFGPMLGEVKLLAFHAAPDWEALRGGRSMVKGGGQPRLPHDDLGFYVAADRAVLERQAALARRHGIQGFCFMLAPDVEKSVPPSTALECLLEAPDMDLPFCVGIDAPSVRRLGDEGSLLHRACADRRAIRVDGAPVLLVRPHGVPQDVIAELEAVRKALAEQGMVRVFLIACWTEGEQAFLERACAAGACDAVLDLPQPPMPRETGNYVPQESGGVRTVPYPVVASHGVVRTQAMDCGAFPFYAAVVVGRDDTSTKGSDHLVYKHFDTRHYRRWLDAALDAARRIPAADRRFVFLQSWNDWNQGQFLEPDHQSGYARLNETSRALLGIRPGLRMPKVSVIVPNYNHERFLRQRLDSIYGQTYRNIEVILMDDCSSDGSRAVLDEYAAVHPEITRTLYNETNSGSPFAQWAKGIATARGDLAWIAESDDYCDERFLETLVRSFDDEAVLLAYGYSVFIDQDSARMAQGFEVHVNNLECAEKWSASYVETAHREVRSALGIKNTIPNASGVLFRRPVDMPLLGEEWWRSMRVAGDWVFYLHVLRGGKIAFNPAAINYFRRYEGSTAESTFRQARFYQEVGQACRTVAGLYDVPLEILERNRDGFQAFYSHKVGRSAEEFAAWFDFDAVLRARAERLPNVMVSTMGFFPGGAEIFPIRLANEFKQQGVSVLLFNVGLNPREEGVRRMLRSDVPVVETSEIEPVKTIIENFGIEVLNSHQWHMQKYPVQLPDVYAGLQAHVATLHGMIEHGNAFAVTEAELRTADRSVSTWVYTADKNLGPFVDFGMVQANPNHFMKMPNGIQTPRVEPVPRADWGMPDDAFVLCCVSRAIPDKGWAEMISAVERARELSGRDIRLVLVGNGPLYDDYRRDGVPPFVHLAGFSDNSAGHYAAADMGIMLTKFRSESFPMTILDCLFAGRPYIATNVGDISNMLTSSEGVAGAVVELWDWQVPEEAAAQVIASFATDSERYRAAVALVPGIASRYRIETVAGLYIDLFRNKAVQLTPIRSH